jgi:hypothetical protein
MLGLKRLSVPVHYIPPRMFRRVDHRRGDLGHMEVQRDQSSWKSRLADYPEMVHFLLHQQVGMRSVSFEAPYIGESPTVD